MKKQWKRLLNHDIINECELCEVVKYCKKRNCDKNMEKLTGKKVNKEISSFLINESLKKLKEKRF